MLRLISGVCVCGGVYLGIRGGGSEINNLWREGGGGHIFFRHTEGQNSVFLKKCLSLLGRGVGGGDRTPNSHTFSVSVLSDLQNP